MKPGRELDALVAEKVMGVQKIPFNPETHVIIGMKDNLPDWTITCPNYSTDIAASEEVEAQLRRMGWHVLTYQFNGETDCIIRIEHDDGREVWTDEYVPKPHAICLAALKVLVKPK